MGTGKIDLRTVLGEVKPADLFTKHLLSRERLKGLVTLFDCHVRSGRAESAPKMRTEVADKKTISDADLATVGERLIFPHREYAEPEVDRLYPPLAVPEAVDAGDPKQYEDDPILVEGYRLVRELVEACEVQGRKRKLDAYGSNADVQLAAHTPCNADVQLAAHTPSSTGGPEVFRRTWTSTLSVRSLWLRIGRSDDISHRYPSGNTVLVAKL